MFAAYFVVSVFWSSFLTKKFVTDWSMFDMRESLEELFFSSGYYYYYYLDAIC